MSPSGNTRLPAQTEHGGSDLLAPVFQVLSANYFRPTALIIPAAAPAVRLPPPVPTAGGADVRWRTCAEWAGTNKLGAVGCPRVLPAADAKMSVTPRDWDAARGMAADELRAGWGGEGRIHLERSEGPEPPRSLVLFMPRAQVVRSRPHGHSILCRHNEAGIEGVSNVRPRLAHCLRRCLRAMAAKTDLYLQRAPA
jgi:hypothetical protein